MGKGGGEWEVGGLGGGKLKRISKISGRWEVEREVGSGKGGGEWEQRWGVGTEVEWVVGSRKGDGRWEVEN